MYTTWDSALFYIWERILETLTAAKSVLGRRKNALEASDVNTRAVHRYIECLTLHLYSLTSVRGFNGACVFYVLINRGDGVLQTTPETHPQEYSWCVMAHCGGTRGGGGSTRCGEMSREVCDVRARNAKEYKTLTSSNGLIGPCKIVGVYVMLTDLLFWKMNYTIIF